MSLFKMRQWCFTLICLSLFAFTSACSNSTNAANPISHSTPSPNVPTATPTPSPTPVPQVSTNCPATGTGRVAVLPSLQLGTNQNIVRLVGSSGAASGDDQLMDLNRYDVQTRTTTTIMSGAIKTAQISQDGQWVLLSDMVNHVSEIQLIRMDGKFLQTLYCAPAGQQVDPAHTTGMQWSPDQKHIVFTQAASVNAPVPLYLLDVITGNVQMGLTGDDQNHAYQTHSWLDNRRVYITTAGDSIEAGAIPSDLFILDTSKGANQHASNLQLVLDVPAVDASDWDFVSSGITA